jgi:CubicO group peptidase (beta-lactamase class C family)
VTVITIRPADIADLDGILEVFNTCWVDYNGVLPVLEIRSGLDLGPGLWRAALSDNQATVIVAAEADRILGVLRYQVEGDIGWIHSLYVHPDSHHGGIGGRLFSEAVRALSARGATTLKLWVFADNERAIGFYRKHGMTHVGVTRTEPEFGSLELQMVKQLPVPSNLAADLLADWPKPSSAPAGAVVGIRQHGNTLIWNAGTTGPKGQPVGPDTVFDLASVTKIVATTTILLKLVESGFDLDKPVDVADWPATFAGITTRDLLAHRAGLWEWQPLYLDPRPDSWQVLAGLGPRYPRGEFHYSDLGFMWLGRVIEAVTGMPLLDAFKKYVAQPLGLRAGFNPQSDGNTAVSALDDRAERTMVETADPYPILLSGADPQWRTQPIQGQVNDGNAAKVFGGVSGHAGLFGTVGDLLDWSELWLTDSAAVTQFLTATSPGQGLGWRIMTLSEWPESPTMFWHPGFTGTAVGIVPQLGLSVVMLTNRLVTAAEPVPTVDLWQRVCRGIVKEIR